jgi:RNA polymerase sigma factor (TIGR02999 family)
MEICTGAPGLFVQRYMHATEILNGLSSNPQHAEELMSLLYGELRSVAANKVKQDLEHSMQPTELVHEVWLKLFGQKTLQWRDRQHFFTVAAEVMRCIVVDHIRKRMTQKRGGGVQMLELTECSVIITALPEELLAVDEALDVLEKTDPQASELVKLRYFAGLTMEETAAVLGISKRSAENIWTYAKLWLYEHIKKDL